MKTVITLRRSSLQLPANRFALPTILAGLVALAMNCAWAEGRPETDPTKPYALIFGTVWGPDERPVYGVKVLIRRADQKKAKWELYSDHQGEFAQRVPAAKADYLVWPDLKGFKPLNGKKLQSGEPVTVHIEYDERADIGLHLKE
jgi:hypothetical protein